MIGLALALAAPGAEVGAPASAKPSGESTIVSSVGFVRGTIGVNGPYWFLVDTGANRSALDTKIAIELGLLKKGSSKVEGSGGSIDVEEGLIPRLEVGGTIIRNLRTTVYDLAGSLAPPGKNVAGILGLDAFGRSAVLWDRAGKRVKIAPSAAVLAPLRGATMVPFVLDNGVPMVSARIDGTPLKLRIDTGASIGDGPATFVNVTQAFYDKLRVRNPALQPYTYFTATGVGGEIRIPVVKAHTMSIGDTTILEPCMIVQPPVGYFARSDAVGFLGGYAFNQSRGFIVDYPRKRLLLLPPKK
jgi:predicted aspartyl protease